MPILLQTTDKLVATSMQKSLVLLVFWGNIGTLMQRKTHNSSVRLVEKCFLLRVNSNHIDTCTGRAEIIYVHWLTVGKCSNIQEILPPMWGHTASHTNMHTAAMKIRTSGIYGHTYEHTKEQPPSSANCVVNTLYTAISYYDIGLSVLITWSLKLKWIDSLILILLDATASHWM